MCRRIEEEIEPTVGLPRHRHSVGFFNVPVQTPTRDPPFYGYSEKPPHFSRLLRSRMGIRRTHSRLEPPENLGTLSILYPVRTPGVKVENTSSVSPACRKMRLKGRHYLAIVADTA